MFFDEIEEFFQSGKNVLLVGNSSQKPILNAGDGDLNLALLRHNHVDLLHLCLISRLFWVVPRAVAAPAYSPERFRVRAFVSLLSSLEGFWGVFLGNKTSLAVPGEWGSPIPAQRTQSVVLAFTGVVLAVNHGVSETVKNVTDGVCS